MVSLGRGPAGPIPTARPPDLTTQHPGCLPGPPLPGREEAWSAGAPAGSGPNPFTLSRTRQSRIPKSHQPACSLARGVLPIESSFAGSEARTPCSLASRKRGQVLDRAGAPRHLSMAGGRHRSPSKRQQRWCPLGLGPAQESLLEEGFSPGQCAPIQGIHNGVPEDCASQLFVWSTTYPRQLSLLRRGPGAALRLRKGRDCLTATAASTPPPTPAPRFFCASFS